MLFTKAIPQYIDSESKEVWYRAAPVCLALGFYWTPRTIHTYAHKDDCRLILINGRAIWHISEAGCYAIALAAKTEEAKEFKRWLCQEVIPTHCKKHGVRLFQESKEVVLPRSDPAVSNSPIGAN